MKFVVFVLSVCEISGGCNVLLYLAKKLAEQGEYSRVYIANEPRTSTIYDRLATREDIDDDTVVIYPEGLPNYLNAKQYIRWVLYGSPMYYETDIVYYYMPFCKNNNSVTKRLTVYYSAPGIENLGLPRIHESCYIVKKGSRYPAIRELFSDHNPEPGICIETLATHVEIIETFNTTKYFHCYDPCSFLVLMALMCGCIVVQHPVDGYTEAEWRYATGFEVVSGFTYGRSNLRHAEETILNAREECLNQINKQDEYIRSFINDMKTGNYVRGSGYNFDASPYSMQHRDKADPPKKREGVMWFLPNSFTRRGKLN